MPQTQPWISALKGTGVAAAAEAFLQRVERPDRIKLAAFDHGPAIVVAESGVEVNRA